MRKQAILLTLAAIAVLLPWGMVHAGPLAQDSLVQVTSPEVSAEVRGLVSIRGSASVPDFQFYKIEFGVGSNPDQWALIGTMHEASVVNGQLEVWDTTLVPDGVYSIRLHAVRADGNYEEFHVRQIVVANSMPTPTPTEEETPTPDGVTTPEASTPSPSEDEVPPEPQATATVQIIAPSTALAVPTATPTLSRPSGQQDLPVDPEGWKQSLVYGAVAMGAVFVVLGAVLGLRRLI